MALNLLRVVPFLFLYFSCSVLSDKVSQKIYEEIHGIAPCVILTNATHQIGCRSNRYGHVGVVHFVRNREDVDWLLVKGKHAPYIPIFTSDSFDMDWLEVLIKQKKINGALVVYAGEYGQAPKSGYFSPEQSCPNDGFGFYDKNSHLEYRHCKELKWNEQGTGMSFLYFDIPIFAMYNLSEVNQLLYKCYEPYNAPKNGAPEYPLCAVELKDFMFAAKDTPTCIRKSNMPNPTQGEFCQPLGDRNVWGTLYPITKPLKNNEVVVLAAKLDTSAFFHDLVKGIDNDASGVIVALAVAKALGAMKRNGSVAAPVNPIMFAFFQGESWDYIGSSKMVYDMEKGDFPLDSRSWKVGDNLFKMKTENIKYFLELNQVGLLDNNSPTLWAHSDPISKQTATETEVKEMLRVLKEAGINASMNIDDPSKDAPQPLPPASFQSFLSANLKIPGIVLTDHQKEFKNKFYNSRFDDLYQVGGNLSQVNDSKVILGTQFTKRLAKVATMVANAVYTLANNGTPPKVHIEADEKMIGNLVYCIYYKANCPLFREVYDYKTTKKSLSSVKGAFSRYVSVNGSENGFTKTVYHLLLYMTGFHLLPSASCSDDNEVFRFHRMRGTQNDSEPDICVNGTVYFSLAVSPAFELEKYDSKEYSTWAESVWNNDLSVRMFLVASPESDIATLMSGIMIVLLSFGLVYFIHKKADKLFTPVDPMDITLDS